MRKAFPTIGLIWADGGYAGKLVEWAKQTARLVLEIVRKPEGLRTFEVSPSTLGGRADTVLADAVPAP